MIEQRTERERGYKPESLKRSQITTTTGFLNTANKTKRYESGEGI